ncbi:MAG: multidrug efflux SMR transporter [Rhodospirillales bacterium]|nr:multidrug efflux SMR transporter [Rhodospirillales bacterium]
MAWLYLLLAGVLEVAWAVSMKHSDGFSRLGPSALTIGLMTVSFGMLALAMRTLPLSVAYTVWTGIGAVGAFVVGVSLLGEHLSPMRAVAAVLIVTGVVMFKISSPAQH